jgi:hypothetical protein
MSPPQGMTLDFRSVPAITTQADFIYSITPDTISFSRLRSIATSTRYKKGFAANPTAPE